MEKTGREERKSKRKREICTFAGNELKCGCVM